MEMLLYHLIIIALIAKSACDIDQTAVQSGQDDKQTLRAEHKIVEVPPPYLTNNLNANNKRAEYTRVGVTHICRNGVCRPCTNYECTLSDDPVNSDGSPSDFRSGVTTQIRIGRLVNEIQRPSSGSETRVRLQHYRQQYPEDPRRQQHERLGQVSNPKQQKPSSGKSKTGPYKAPATFPCSQGRCSTCINQKCYPRTYAALKITAHDRCPPAACDIGCQGFQRWSDGCPICACTGYYTREPCFAYHDCPATSACTNFICRYSSAPPSQTHPPPRQQYAQCRFAYQCRHNEDCVQGTCVAAPRGTHHVENQTCSQNYHCPQNYVCRDATCWVSNAHEDYYRNNPAPTSRPLRHPVTPGGQKSQCFYYYNCPSSATICQPSPCINGQIVGTRSNQRCLFNAQCPHPESCVNYQCVYLQLPVNNQTNCYYTKC